MMSKGLGIVGVSGRLGRQLLSLAPSAGWTVTLRVNRASWLETSPPLVVIDVSHVSMLGRVLDYCVANEAGLVYGTSNLGDAERRALLSAAEQIPVVLAPNFTFGHQLQRHALAAMLGALAGHQHAWQLTVLERHPPTKRDAPSATAISLDAACEAAGMRSAGEIQSVRGGLPVSDHTVLVSSSGEQVTLMHEVSDLSAAANGALRAAEWALDRATGCWSMQDVHDGTTAFSSIAGPETI
jgi:4-hydroxy-tetrahydrodipicolinate reductase